MKAFLLVLLLATPVFASDSLPPSTRLPPLRPTAEDVSWEVRDAGYPFRFCPIRQPPGGAFYEYVPATQTCMDAMAERSLVEMIQLARNLRYVNGSQKVIDFCLSDSQGASAITAFLNPVYEGNFGEYRGDWAEDWSAKDYGKPAYCAKKARTFLLYRPVECATTPELQPSLAFLNLAVIDGQCVDVAEDPIYPATIDKRFKTLGTIDYDHRQPALTSEQLRLLHATHEAHRVSSEAKCGGPAPTGSVQAAHVALEASARTEAEHHFFVLKAFSGIMDPRWTPAEACKWARLQDADHMRWMAAVEAGNWAASRKAENDHQASHFCANLRDERLKIRRTDCGDSNVNHCAIETCFDVLKRLP